MNKFNEKYSIIIEMLDEAKGSRINWKAMEAAIEEIDGNYYRLADIEQAISDRKFEHDDDWRIHVSYVNRSLEMAKNKRATDDIAYLEVILDGFKKYGAKKGW